MACTVIQRYSLYGQEAIFYVHDVVTCVV